MPIDDDAGRAAVAFARAWRLLAGTTASALVAEHDGLLVAATGLPDPTVNPAYALREPAAPHDAVRWTAQVRADLPRPSTGIDLPDGRWPGLEAALRDLGYVERVRRPGMVAAVDEVAPASDDALSLRRVREERDWLEYVAVQTEVFGIAPDVAAQFPPYSAVADPRVVLLVGEVDGGVATTAQVLVAGDLAGVYAIATRAAHRRRGLGAATTSGAVRVAAELGARHVALQATAQGHPLYRRLGFRDVGDWVVWVDPSVEPAPG